MKGSEDVVMWVQLPKPMGVAELNKLGLAGAACFGGDTCIAATAQTAEAGIVVERSAGDLFRQASLRIRPDCFSGNLCIV